MQLHHIFSNAPSGIRYYVTCNLVYFVRENRRPAHSFICAIPAREKREWRAVERASARKGANLAAALRVLEKRWAVEKAWPVRYADYCAAAVSPTRTRALQSRFIVGIFTRAESDGRHRRRRSSFSFNFYVMHQRHHHSLIRRSCCCCCSCWFWFCRCCFFRPVCSPTRAPLCAGWTGWFARMPS